MQFSKESKQVISIFVIIIMLLSAALAYSVYYLNSSLKNAKDECNNQVSALNTNLVKSISSMRNQFDDEIFRMQSNYSLRMDYYENTLKAMREQNNKEIKALSTLIAKIEEQSSIQFEELKDEVTDIQVKSSDFSGVINDAMLSIVSIGTETGIGSGAIIDDAGFIVTNYHVVSGKKVIRALTYSGYTYDAKLIGYEPVIDVAVIKIEGKDFGSLKFGNSEELLIGERVVALGSPAGLSFSATEGIISAVNRKGSINIPIYIQHDVPINAGNSGGPLINSEGRIIGINNYKISGYEGLGFAIESNTVKNLTDDIIQYYYNQTIN